MTRAAVALVLFLVFAALGFGWRTLVQVRRYGDTGWRVEHDGPDRVIAPLLAAAFLLLGAAPVLALVAGEPWRPGGFEVLVEGTLGAVTALGGVALVLVGGAVTVAAQVQMGASWRIGVQAGERTDLVTGGLFGHVRNPIFSGMMAVSLGIALLVPSAVAIAGAALAVGCIVVQVRAVEEPNLRRVHGTPYLAWARRTGRFVPGVGRL